ncbi:MAG: anaerobic ribonucleoside-triphosphate reductase activating protein [Candidatus Micrarchaeota archaeon]
MDIKGIQNSLIDYPGNICLTIFTGGCNYRCPFCHNSDLVLKPEQMESIDIDAVMQKIKNRANLVDGITVTGGEPLINKDLGDFLASVKDVGMKTKLDTNGSFPIELEGLISRGVLDYIAMDVKTSPEKYSLAAGVRVDIGAVRESADIIRSSKVDYEFRTTVVPTLVNAEDIDSIGKWLNGSKRYYLQQFSPEESLSAEFRKMKEYGKSEIMEFKRIAERYFLNVGVRGL